MTELFANFDLFIVGIITAATAVVGLIVFLNNRKSATNRTFFMFCIFTIIYALTSYVQTTVHNPDISLWLVRITIALAAWHAFSLFHLFYVFPKDIIVYDHWYSRILIPSVAVVSLLNLSPFVFKDASEYSPDGKVLNVITGPGIIFFALLIFFLIFGGIALLLWKTKHAKEEERPQFVVLARGTIATFILILIFNFFFPAFLNDARFVDLVPLFFLPFLIAATHAIIRFHLFNARLIAAQAFTFTLAVVALIETVVSPDTTIAIIFRMLLFPMVLGVGMLLIRSVQREVEQREELARLSAFKTQLLSIASHQIKSPLAAIKGFASILLQGLYGPLEGQARETVQKMEHASDSLIALINNLLDFRRVEEGKIEYNLAAVDFGELAQHAVDLLEPLAKEKGIALSYDRPHVPVVVSADAQKLQEVVQNLIDNAVKYTPKGQVTVTLVREDKTALLAVKDSGLGISAELLPHLFAEFVRDENVKRQIRGTGLGLYIARKMIEGQKGMIWAESAGEGEGSQFFVRLPLG